MGYFPQVAALPQRFFGPITKLQWWKAGLVLFLVAWLYSSILFHLASQWWNDANFSHGFFVPIFSYFVLWRKCSDLANIKPQPSAWGFGILVISLCLLVTGVLGAELFLSRISLLLLVAGLTIFFRGWRFFRAVLFPWAFLFLMIPIPAIIFNHITFPLQIFASKIAATLLPLMGVPVLREGNIINLASMPLEVAEACSGIRSLLSLMTLAIIYGYLTETRNWVRILLALTSIPIAVIANSLRIVGTGMLAEYWSPTKAEGFFHSFSGWLIFLVSLMVLTLFHSLVGRRACKEEPPNGN